MTFKRVVEDFDCERCGQHNAGDGYTNHCWRCLYSKHVDTAPGDRASVCGGLMAPVDVWAKRGQYVVLHRCLACGFEQPCRTSSRDSHDVIRAVAQQKAEGFRG